MITVAPFTDCFPSPGDDWKILSENVTDSYCLANALPRGPGYVFRVACITKTGSGPFSDTSPPAFMAVPYEGEKISNSCLCNYQAQSFIKHLL